jgi:ABC-2 type transport system permease protein
MNLKMGIKRNPVITSEMKIKMRGWRTALAVAAYLAVLLFIGFLYYLTFIESSYSYRNTVNAFQEMGMQLYSMLAVLQFSLLILITPAQTAGSISGEREKQTLDLLLSTKISSFGIIFGKLISSMSYVLLLIITSIPLFSLIFLFGGVTPGDMIKLFLFYIITVFSVGSIGIFFSTVFKRTVTSTVITYIVIFFLGLISVILGIYMIQAQVRGTGHLTNPRIPFILYINPAVGLADILTAEQGGVSQFLGYNIGTQTGLDFWIINSIVMMTIAAGLLYAGVKKINPIHRKKKRKKQA